MSEILPCPCGQTPTHLSIQSENANPQYASAFGGCCGEWSVEFRNDYAQIDSDASQEKARVAWNAAPRAQPAPAVDLVKRLADHIENVDNIPLMKWAMEGCFLVNEAKAMVAANSGKGE